MIASTLDALIRFGGTRAHTALAVCLPGVTVLTIALYDLV